MPYLWDLISGLLRSMADTKVDERHPRSFECSRTTNSASLLTFVTCAWQPQYSPTWVHMGLFRQPRHEDGT